MKIAFATTCLLALLGSSLAAFNPNVDDEEKDEFSSKVTILSDSDFPSWREHNPKALVMFFAPWCGHCKSMKPDYAKLASTITPEDDVAVAAVDCTSTGSQTCQDQGVRGYPTLKYFASSTGEGQPYEGERTLRGFRTFLKRKVDPSYKDPEEEKEAEFKNAVPHIEGSADDFATWRESHPRALVMFYAPWCGHCKAMKPDFIQLAPSVPEGFSLAAVDCTAAGSAICSEFSVSGYPTILYFDSADAAEEKYDGSRTAKGLRRFLMKKQDPEWREEFQDVALWEVNGKVSHVGDEHWEWYRSQNPRVFTFFYAPWCGHCKNAKPEFAEASRHFGGKNTVKFVAVDCTESQETCSKYGVKGYPTIKFFVTSDDTTGVEYDEGRLAQTMTNWLDRQLLKLAKKEAEAEDIKEEDVGKLSMRVLKQLLKDRGVECSGCSEKSEFVARVKETLHLPKVEKKKFKMTWGEEQRMKKTKEHAEKGWEVGNGKVKHVTDFDFDEHIAKGNTLVMFYADWCGHCKSLKPEYVAASEELDGKAVLAAIECPNNPTICNKFSVSSYPTLMWFESSGKSSKVSGSNKKALVSAVMKNLDPDWVPQVQPFKNEKVWGSENGEVVHLNDEHFESYKKDHPNMLVMFYAPWCGHCKSFKPAFAEASTELKNLQDKVILAAVDCTENSEVCGHYDVKGYPTIKFFSTENPEGVDAQVERSVSGVVKYVKSEVAKLGDSVQSETVSKEGRPDRDEL